MSRTAVPAPLAAAVGLVPAVLSGVCRLPGRALRLPVLALTGTVSLVGAARQEYDDLASRGERLYARLRGQRLPPASVADADLGSLDVPTVGVPTAGAPTVVDLRDEERPKGTPTPKAPQNTGGQGNGQRSAGPVETAASPEVVDLVEAIVEELATGPVAAAGIPVAGAAPVLAHGDLPLPDYDHLTLGSLRGRLRALDVVQLVSLRDYEKSHANRLPVVTMLDNRIAKLATTGAGPVLLSGEGDRNGSTPSG